MAAAPDVMAAFQSGAGLSGVTAHAAIAVVLAAVMLTWLTWSLAGVGTRVLEGRLSHHQGLFYVIRALVLAMVVLFYLLG